MEIKDIKDISVLTHVNFGILMFTLIEIKLVSYKHILHMWLLQTQQ